MNERKSKKSIPSFIVPLFLMIVIGASYFAIKQSGTSSSIIAKGQIYLEPNLLPKAQGIQTLFLTVFDGSQDSGMMPVGAIKYPLDGTISEHVLDFVLTKDNLKIMQPELPFPKVMRIKAKLDRLGVAQKDKPGDLVGEVTNILYGSQDVRMNINRFIEE